MPGWKVLADGLKRWAKALKQDGATLWFAASHRDVPWYSKALASLVVAYAFSPIDLIPDFIPLLGLVDDLILLPGLIYLTLKTLPGPVLTESRAKAQAWMAREGRRPRNRAGLVLVVSIWLALAVAGWIWIGRPLVAGQGTAWAP